MSSGYEAALQVLAKYEVVVAGVALPFCLLTCVLGYILLRPLLFLTGFGVGGLCAYTAAFRVTTAVGSAHSAWISITAMLVCGLLVGLLAALLVPLGVFLVGASCGIAIILSLRTLILGIDTTHAALIFYILCLASAVVAGFLAVLLQQPVIIVCTAVSGAFGFVYAVGIFAGAFPRTLDATTLHNAHTWLYFGGFVLLTLVGVVTQFVIVARGKEREASGSHARKGNSDVQPLKRSEARPAQVVAFDEIDDFGNAGDREHRDEDIEMHAYPASDSGNKGLKWKSKKKPFV
ncbi:hypothetical protein FVE85_5013 [Porphyridium purpureum]|uniref:Transmembrane protein 198 n=1 Tax=Porphyridium purpureum TaxID=35688 RepID=A0A5J4YRF3_PORPP|nr:hypothetical protein FVE85_5013 [Porphyridium purpureum]|eukprot:POR1402..scf236_6